MIDVATFDGSVIRNIVMDGDSKRPKKYYETGGDLKQYDLDEFFPALLVNSGLFPVRVTSILHQGDYWLSDPTKDMDTLIIDKKMPENPSRIRLRCAKMKVNGGRAFIERIIEVDPAKDFAIVRIMTYLNTTLIEDHRLSYNKVYEKWHVGHSILERYHLGKTLFRREDDITIDFPSSPPDTALMPTAGLPATRTTFKPEDSPFPDAPSIERNLIVDQNGELTRPVSPRHSRWRLPVVIVTISLILLSTWLIVVRCRQSAKSQT